MDVLKVLIYMAAAALLAALGMTWKDFKKERAAEPPEKVFEVKRQIREIEMDRERMQADRDRITGKAAPPPPTTVAPDAPPPPSSDVDLAAIDAASTLSDPSLDTEGHEAEPAAPLTADDRAKAIAAAPVVAKIAEWVESPEVGTFGALEIVDATKVQTGAMLSVRRNSGIIARLKVEITEDGALATPTSSLGELKPQVGDELIVDPEAK